MVSPHSPFCAPPISWQTNRQQQLWGVRQSLREPPALRGSHPKAEGWGPKPRSSYHSMLRDRGRKADSSAEAYSAFLVFSCFCLTDKREANLERLLSDLGRGKERH